MSGHLNANLIAHCYDDNERHALEECARREHIDRQVSVFVFPAGRCVLAIQFASLGAHVTVGDLPAHQREAENRALARGVEDNITFLPCTLSELPLELPGAPYDIIVLRRGLVRLPYRRARDMLRQLLLSLKIGGKLYVSILGLHSELGNDYPGRDLPIEQRFTHLSPAMAAKYDISDPVCLYSERNLFMLLLEAGASVLRTQTTTYGNVKGIGVRV